MGAECSCLLEVGGRQSSHQEAVGSEEEYRLCMYSTEQTLYTHVLVLLPGHVNDTDPLAVAEVVTREVIEGTCITQMKNFQRVLYLWLCCELEGGG